MSGLDYWDGECYEYEYAAGNEDVDPGEREELGNKENCEQRF